MTPRKPRPRQHLQPGPTPLIQASDYESDSMNDQSDPLPSPPPNRTNTELNLTVLRRLPGLSTIVSIPTIAANAVLYSFDLKTTSWEKLAMEGTFFITSDYDLDIETGNETFNLVILNRKGLSNFVVDIGDLLDVEVTGELVIIGMKGKEEEREVRGLWFHEDREGIREEISAKIKELWDKIMAVRESMQEGFEDKQTEANSLTFGRRLSLSEMFDKASKGKGKATEGKGKGPEGQS